MKIFTFYTLFHDIQLIGDSNFQIGSYYYKIQNTLFKILKSNFNFYYLSFINNKQLTL